MSQETKSAKEMSPAQTGVAGCLAVFLICVFGIAILTLLGPVLAAYVPVGAVANFLSSFGGWEPLLLA